MKRELTQEQVTALQGCARAYGRTWKASLRSMWESGVWDSDLDIGTLQGIRNTFGPSWLAKYKIPEYRSALEIKADRTYYLHLSAIGCPSRKVAVWDSIEAVKVFEAYRDGYNLGGSQFKRGCGNVTDGKGKLTARISYNGRVWTPDGKPLDGLTGSEWVKQASAPKPQLCCIGDGCGMPYDPTEPETRDTATLKPFWTRYCPKHRALPAGQRSEPITCIPVTSEPVTYSCPNIHCGAVFTYSRTSCGKHAKPNYCPDCGKALKGEPDTRVDGQEIEMPDSRTAHWELRNDHTGHIPKPHKVWYLICDECGEPITDPAESCDCEN